MKTLELAGVVLAVLLLPTAAQAPVCVDAILAGVPTCHLPGAAPAGAAVAPTTAPGVFPGLGVSGYAVESVLGGTDGEAGRYFADGVRLTHAFNAPEAIRAFQWSRVEDPNCAMCAWGEAWARGPTINYPVTGEAATRARTAAQDAMKLAVAPGAHLSDKARGLIRAQADRFPLRGGRALTDDRAYARDMEALAARFPADDAVATEAADALMIASHAWEEAATKPRSDTGRARTLIETVLARDPDFDPALHFHIHLMEGAGLASKAEGSADRLERLLPAAGHLTHMPSHIYYRVGRFEDAATANARASASDALYVRDLKPPGGLREFALHGHNVSFGLGGALMSGDGPGALAFASETLKWLTPGGFGRARAYFAYAHYAEPKDVLALPRPSGPVDEAMWRFARGEAKARLGDAAGVAAEAQEIARVEQAAAGKVAPQRRYLEIARLTLLGRAALLERRWPDAIRALSQASDIREQTSRDNSDPPGWGFPPLRTLAAARLLSGDGAGAERDAARSLKGEPNDPLAFFVLAEARKARDPASAARYRAAADRIWRGRPDAMRLPLV